MTVASKIAKLRRIAASGPICLINDERLQRDKRWSVYEMNWNGERLEPKWLLAEGSSPGLALSEAIREARGAVLRDAAEHRDQNS